MPKNSEASKAATLLDTQEHGDGDGPEIVLDVIALETDASATATGNSSDLRNLPDELLGMYYHG